MHFTVVSFQKN